MKLQNIVLNQIKASELLGTNKNILKNNSET